MPADAAVPRLMTPVPADAVGTYGWDAVAWIESEMGIRLRWWQKLSIVRQLEHRADGSLCFRLKVESAPRRSGKSVGLRGGALWRMEHGRELFGEDQDVIHTGSDMAIVREIQRGAWAWARARWGEKSVKTGNGKESIEAPFGRWLARAQDAVYGYDCMLGLVDEGWNVKPDTVTEGLEPAMLERESPQLVLTSTAHRRATSLMRTMLQDAEKMTDPETLLLLWGAPLGADPSDPAVWRAASPHWSEDRRKLIAAKYAKALAGEQDKEFDDPDPMRGFEAQYLNVWRLAERQLPGDPIVNPDAWDTRARPDMVPGRDPDVVAVEAWFDHGVSVARAWKLAGSVIVAVRDYPDVPTAAAGVSDLGYASTPIVGASLTEHAAWAQLGIPTTKKTGTTRNLVGDLVRYLGEHAFYHDGSPHLRGQITAMRTSPGTDGIRIRSTARADAIKAVAWAVEAATNFEPPAHDEVIVIEWD